MFAIKLKILSKFRNKRLLKKVDDVNVMQTDVSVAWNIFAFITKTAILLFFGALILFPFFFMISTSLMSDTEVTKQLTPITPLTPQSGFHWENFTRAFSDGYFSALLITIIVTIASVILKILFTMTMGYAFSYKKWWGKKIIWWFMIALMMIPEIALMVGQYTLVTGLRMHIGPQSVITMFLPFIASIFSAFMFRNAFEQIPMRTKEAALIDGATEFKYFVKVAVPMVTPTIWTTVILTAFASWNSYIWPQMVTFGSPNPKRVLGTWLLATSTTLKSDGTTEVLMNIRMAASILVMLPMFITYFLFRRRIMNAVSKQGSAIKG